MTDQTQQIIPEDRLADRGFKLRRIFLLVLYVVAAIGVLSFDPADIDFLASGLTGLSYPHNRLGAVGAYVSWTLLLSIGLATYPLMFLLLVCSLRRLVWRGGLQRTDWAYRSAIPLFALGMSFLLALNPPAVRDLAAMLNLKGIPGGVIGLQFCAPGSGWIYIMLSTTGVVVLSSMMLAVSLGMIWYYDWRDITCRIADYATACWRKWHVSATAATSDGAAQPPDGSAAAAAAAAPPPEPAQVSTTFAGADNAGATFRTRRGEASMAAARAAEEAINGGAHRPASPTPQFTPTARPAQPRQQPLPEFAPAPASAPPPAQSASRAAATADAGRSCTIDCLGEEAEYALPDPAGIFTPVDPNIAITSHEEIEEKSEIIQNTLDEFEVDAEVSGVVNGPQITLFEITLGPKVFVNKLNSVLNNLTMNLKAHGNSVRIIKNIPGKCCAGIEVPNSRRQIVYASDLFGSREWQCCSKSLPLMLGKSITGDRIIMDLADAPHLLVAGATGQGKSVCVNLMIQSMLLRFSPDDLKLVLVDPKFVEFTIYAHLPHLLTPVINDVQKVGLVLRWAASEMNRRCRLLALVNTRNLREFNQRKRTADEPKVDQDGEPIPDRLPYIVIIIDELADIMAYAKKEVEPAIQVLAQKARAAGIHLILSTQRPDKDIVTGIIKANFPVRIALTVTNSTNSRIILDESGAESLLGAGDMLLKDKHGLTRIQCGMVSPEEIEQVCKFCASQAPQIFDADVTAALEARENEENLTNGAAAGDDARNAKGGDPNDLVSQALQVMLRNPRKWPTISFFQMALQIGYGRSKRLVNDLEEMGYIGPLVNDRSGEREIYWDAFPGYGGGDSADDDALPPDADPGDMADDDGGVAPSPSAGKAAPSEVAQ